MKRYTTYKKTEQPYFNFSELLGFPILPICAIAFISYVVLFFFGLTVMLAANVGIAVVLTIIYNGLKNASPNGSRNGISQEVFVILSLFPSFLLILGVILIANIGPYIIVTFQYTRVFYTTYFYVWLFVLLALPVLYFVVLELKYQFQLHYQAYCFTPLSLNIVRDYELITLEARIAFLQTEKKWISEVIVAEAKKTEHIGKLNKLSVSERNACLYEPVFNETVYIPKNTNRLKISWYSAVEDVYYSDEIDFPFERLQYVENNYPLNGSKFLRGKKSERVTLLIQQGGRIQLFNTHQNILEPVAAHSVQISDDKKKQLVDALTFIYPVKDLSVKLNSIKQSHAIEKRAELFDYACNWQVTGGGLEGHNIELKDVRYNYTTNAPIALNTFEQRLLPIFFEIDYHKASWLYIHIDAEKLYDLIQQTPNKEPFLTFDLSLDLEKGTAELLIKNNDNILPFTAWEKKVNEYRLKDAKEILSENKDHTIKNNFLKGIYELIVKKDYLAAQQLCKAALKTYPYFPMIYFYEARLLWYLQGFETSYAQETCFVDKTKTDPYSLAQIYNYYGCLYDEENRYAESLERFEKAYASYPQQLFYLANIAEIYYKLKNAKQALYYAQQCIKKEFTSAMIAEIVANKGMQD